MMTLFYMILPIFVLFCLWLSYRILRKAGLDGRWCLVLLLPVINVIMIWVFAFCHWPNLRNEVDQGL